MVVCKYTLLDSLIGFTRDRLAMLYSILISCSESKYFYVFLSFSYYTITANNVIDFVTSSLKISYILRSSLPPDHLNNVIFAWILLIFAWIFSFLLSPLIVPMQCLIYIIIRNQRKIYSSFEFLF